MIYFGYLKELSTKNEALKTFIKKITMEITVKELLKQTNCKESLKKSKLNVVINNISELLPKNSNPNTLFWCNLKNQKKLKTISSGVFIIDKSIDDKYLNDSKDCIYIHAENPRQVFTRAIELFSETDCYDFNNMDKNRDYGLNVVVDNDCLIGENVRIGHNTVILPSTIVGDNVSIGCNCTIGNTGFGYEKDNDGVYKKIAHLGNVIIEDNVDIGNNTCIDRAVLGSTIIGENTKIDNLVHIAHGVKIGRNCLIIANSMIAGSVVIADNCHISPSVSILNQKSIDEDSVIGMGAVVLKDVLEGETWVGNPAQKIKLKKIAIVTAIYQRPELTAVVFEWYEKLKDILKNRIEIGLFAVGSEGEESRKLCNKYGFEYVEAPNSPLNKKFNKVVELAKHFNPDGVILVGSDDIIDKNLVLHYADNLKKHDGINNIYGFDKAYIYHIMEDKLIHFLGYGEYNLPKRKGEPVGSGRFFGKSVLNKLDWNLWDDNIEIDSNLDGNCTKRLEKNGFKFKTFSLAETNSLILGIKDKKHITDYFKNKNCYKLMKNSKEFITKYLGKGAVNKILGLNEKKAIVVKSDNIVIPDKTKKRENTNEKGKGALINVLTRTHRPNRLSKAIESLNSQTHKNIRQIFSVDSDFSENFIKQIIKSNDYVRNLRIEPNDFFHLPHNLYINSLLEMVDDGWVYILDDGDILIENTALELMIDTVESKDEVLLFQMIGNDGMVLPVDKEMSEMPKISRIGGSCIFVHSSIAKTIEWDNQRCADFRYIEACCKKASKVRRLTTVLIANQEAYSKK